MGKLTERLFPGRHFTPDGHLVGSLGEVWAAHLSGMTLAPASNRGYDGTCPDGQQVQIIEIEQPEAEVAKLRGMLGKAGR